MKKKPLVEIKNLHKYFIENKKVIKAVDDVSFKIYPGETFALLGESGSGKSTLGKLLVQLEKPTSGKIFFNEENIVQIKGKKNKWIKQQMQMIFQDPYTSLNPRMNIKNILTEPFLIHKKFSKEIIAKKVLHLLKIVNLSPFSQIKFPHEFSGGQRQRIAIARALSLNPQFIVCDEPISSLDTSVRLQIISLLQQMQKDFLLSYLFIAHDLNIVKYIATKVAIMYAGQFVEMGSKDKVYKKHLHPYTQFLFNAEEKLRSSTCSDTSSKGCIYVKHCPHAQKICLKSRPKLIEVEKDHHVACHRFSSRTGLGKGNTTSSVV